jgi:hypothetical protein
MQHIERLVTSSDAPDYVEAATALQCLADEFRSVRTAQAFVYRLEGAAATLEAVGVSAAHLPQAS